MDLQAVVTDLDGTILNDRRLPSRQDMETAHDLRARGVPLYLCTARHHTAAALYARLLGAFKCAVTCNGAGLYDFQEDRYVEPPAVFSQKTAQALYAFGEENRLLHYACTDRHMYLSMRDERYLPEVRGMRMGDEPPMREGLRLMEEHPEVASLHCIKWSMVRMTPAQTEALLSRFPECGFALYRGSSGRCTAEIAPRGCSKGEGFLRAMRLMGHDPQRVLALGDSLNDASMLRLCGYPAVPQNASPDLKPYARYIVAGNNDSPLTDALRRIMDE